MSCAGVGPPRHTQCATSPVCTTLRVVGPLGRGRRDPGPAARGPAPGAEVALGTLSCSSPARWSISGHGLGSALNNAGSTCSDVFRGGLGPGGAQAATRATSSNSVFQVTSAPGAGTPSPVNPGVQGGGDGINPEFRWEILRPSHTAQTPGVNIPASSPRVYVPASQGRTQAWPRCGCARHPARL